MWLPGSVEVLGFRVCGPEAEELDLDKPHARIMILGFVRGLQNKCLDPQAQLAVVFRLSVRFSLGSSHLAAYTTYPRNLVLR